MSGHNRPAIIIAGVAGLCLSAAAGVGLGSYCASGVNPIYSQAPPASAYADEATALDGTIGDNAEASQISEAALRGLHGDDGIDRTGDDS